VEEVLVARESRLKVLHELAGLLLDLEGNLDGAVDVLSHLLKVLLLEVPGSQGGGANPDATRGERAGISVHGVLVDADAGNLGGLLNLAAGQAEWAQVHHQEVVVSAVRHQLVALLYQSLGQGAAVLLDLNAVLLELWGGGLPQGGGHGGDSVVVGSALVGREDGKVHALLQVGLLTILQLAEEDKAGTRTTEGLVGGGGDYIGELERVGGLLGGDEPGDVGNVGHKVRAVDVGDLPEAGVIPLARVGAGTANDQLRAEELGVLLQGVIVYVSSFLGGANWKNEEREKEREGDFGCSPRQPGMAWTRNRWQRQRSSSWQSGSRG